MPPNRIARVVVVRVRPNPQLSQLHDTREREFGPEVIATKSAFNTPVSAILPTLIAEISKDYLPCASRNSRILRRGSTA